MELLVSEQLPMCAVAEERADPLGVRRELRAHDALQAELLAEAHVRRLRLRVQNLRLERCFHKAQLHSYEYN